MNRKSKILFFLIMITVMLLLCMCGKDNRSLENQNIVIEDETITIHNMNYEKETSIYNLDYQQKLFTEIDRLKKSQKFTIENPLVIINPFETNATGIYIYFKSDIKSYLNYNIYIADDEVKDFNKVLKNDKKNNLTKEHEYMLIGGVAGKENIITLKLYDKNDEIYCLKNFKISLPELDNGSDYILTKEEGESSEELSDGLFVTMGHINNKNNNTNTYYYDNDGICRAQINLDNYRIDRLVFKDDLMYISVDKNKIAALDRIGYVKDVYDLGKYEMHHDYILDNKGNMLILVSDTESDSVEDKIIRLNLKNKSIDEIIDLGKLFPDMKEKAILPSNKDKLDWIHVNSFLLLNDDTLLLSSRETSTIINIGSIYRNPKVQYLIGDKKMWQDTNYKDRVLKKDGDFPIHGGQHALTVVHDDTLNKGEYYLYFYNNNTGTSSHYPDYDWSTVKNIDTNSMYYKYLVNENDKSFSLVKELTLDPSRYISSVQEYKNHIVADSGQSRILYEFDSNDDLIAKFIVEEEMWGLYRCFKYDFNNFYFHEI